MPDPQSDTDKQPPSGPFITLAEAAELSGLSHSHLRLLVREGKIQGVKLGRDWLTTKAAIETYLASERKPGPKPRD